MALIIADRVFESSTSTGTADFVLGGAQLGYRTFLAGIGASNTTYYSAANAGLTEWEIGLGTLSADGLTLARTTIFSSSNSNTKVSFSSGSKSVFCDMPASKLYYIDGSGNTAMTLVGTALTSPTITGGTIQSTNLNSMVNLLLVGL